MMLKKWLPIVLVTLLAVFLILLKFDSGLYQSFTHKDKSVAFSKSEKVVQQNAGYKTKHRDPFIEPTFPFGRKVNEDFAKKYPDQFSIVKKMFYSWDYIHTAQGEYSWGHPLDGGISKSSFYVDLDRGKNLGKEIEIQNGKVVEKYNVLLNNKMGYRELPRKKIYTQEKIKNNKRGSAESNEMNYLQLFNKIITNSEWWALIYNNYPDWTYKVGTKEGMPVYLIKGVIKSNTSPDLAGPFTMVVSKDTGALLDLKCYGHHNKLIFFVSSKNLKINQGIPNEEKVFKLNVSGDKKLSFPDFNSQTIGMQAVKGEKKGGVSQ